MKKEHIEEINKIIYEGREVYLQGSRRMAERTTFDLPEDTDYDYAVDYLYQEQIYGAISRGWIELVDRSYCDSNTSIVLEKMIGGDKVQLSSRTNLEEFKTAFESIDPEYYFKELRSDKGKLRDVLEKGYNDQRSVYVHDIPF